MGMLRRLRDRDKDNGLVGAEAGILGKAHFAARAEVEAAGLIAERGIRFGHYSDGKSWDVLRYAGDAHLITVAPTGTGKGRDVLVGALLEYKGSCIVIDPKGQLAAITRAQREHMGQKVIVLNPFGNVPRALPMDLGRSARYNPMSHLDPESEAFGPDCRSIADAIVVRPEGERDSHWTDSARQVITGLIMYHAAIGKPAVQNLGAVRQLIAGPSGELARTAQAALQMENEFIGQKLARFADEKAANLGELASILSTADTQTGFIDSKAIVDNLSVSDFQFGDLKREPTTVYLVLPARYIEPCGKWFRLVVASAITELMSEERGKYPVLAILDEFAQLGRLQVIAEAMGMARGFGLQLWPILQDLTQLKGHYGDLWETFLGGAAIRQFFGPRDQFTAEHISKLCGTKTITTPGQSVQHAAELLQRDRTGASWSLQGVPLLRPEDASQLGENEAVILGPNGIVINAFRQPYYETREFNGPPKLYSPDPYHNVGAVAS